MSDQPTKPEQTNPAELRQIFADARKFSAQFGGFLKAAEFLDRYGNIDTLIAANEERLKQTQANLAAAEENASRIRAAAEVDAARIRQQADAHLENRKAEADSIITKAKRTATTEANSIRETANVAAEQKRAAVIGEIDQHTATLAGLKTDIAKARSELQAAVNALEAVNINLAATRREHERVSAEHNAFLAKIGAKNG